VEEELRRVLAALLKPCDVAGRKVRLMFQDEARFGRMVRIRRSWAPRPQRPMVCNGYEREFVCVYGAVSPLQGQLDWLITRKMHTTPMSAFLAQLSARHRRDFIVMVVDGASSHGAKDLVIPKNMRLLRPLPYAPELNPQEQVWDELREKAFPNRVFTDLDSVLAQLQKSLPRLAADRAALRSLTSWSWIVSRNLGAHQDHLCAGAGHARVSAGEPALRRRGGRDHAARGCACRRCRAARRRPADAGASRRTGSRPVSQRRRRRGAPGGQRAQRPGGA